VPRERTGKLDAEGIATLVALLAGESPAAHVRIVLAEHRRNGVSFNVAWGNALRSVPRTIAELEEWRSALRWSRESYRLAYERLPLPERQDDRSAA
jgi:hypothetical protein